MKRIFLLLFMMILVVFSQAQSRKEELRGGDRLERTCFDIYYYDLTFQPNGADQSIAGKVEVHSQLLKKSKEIQMDLFENMILDSILNESNNLSFRREFDAVFIELPLDLKIGERFIFTMHYHGMPVIAKMPPWDGGVTWATEENGKPWWAVSCQGKGASLWWPTKEDYRDEPDSMRIHCRVSSDLYAVCNGLEESPIKHLDNTTTYNWKVSYPINNYNVTFNIADYAHWSDQYIAQDGDTLILDYYVLKKNLDKSKVHFQQVKPMLNCYETYLGKYPFFADGYALVETPYLGMEHQGAIAYGNRYARQYLGMDRSGQKLDFDYIIIHETGHEWWGNSVSAGDMADMWIHESFCTYSEAIYVECIYGYDVAMNYVNALRSEVSNTSPIIGVYGLNREGHGDMYVKGMLFLNSLRHTLDNDLLWWGTIKKMADSTFKHRVTNFDEVVRFFNNETQRDLTPFFDQYVKHSRLPELQYCVKSKKGKTTIEMQWKTEVSNFEMPVEYKIGDQEYRVVLNSNLPFKTTVNGDFLDIELDQKKFYFKAKKN